MKLSRGPGLPTSDSMLGRDSGLHEDTLTGQVYSWSGSAWSLLPTSSDQAGSAFPTTNLYDGRPFVRTDHNCTPYNYKASIGKWLSAAVYEISGGESTAIIASTYLRMAINANEQRYSALRGWVYGFDVVCVGMTLFAGGSSTATVEVHDDGSAVTGASISLSSQTGPVTSEALLSSVIAAGSVIGLYCNSTGTLNTVAIARARFRRCAA